MEDAPVVSGPFSNDPRFNDINRVMAREHLNWSEFYRMGLTHRHAKRTWLRPELGAQRRLSSFFDLHGAWGQWLLWTFPSRPVGWRLVLWTMQCWLLWSAQRCIKVLLGVWFMMGPGIHVLTMPLLMGWDDRWLRMGIVVLIGTFAWWMDGIFQQWHTLPPPVHFTPFERAIHGWDGRWRAYRDAITRTMSWIAHGQEDEAVANLCTDFRHEFLIIVTLHRLTATSIFVAWSWILALKWVIFMLLDHARDSLVWTFAGMLGLFLVVALPFMHFFSVGVERLLGAMVKHTGLGIPAWRRAHWMQSTEVALSGTIWRFRRGIYAETAILRPFLPASWIHVRHSSRYQMLLFGLVVTAPLATACVCKHEDIFWYAAMFLLGMFHVSAALHLVRFHIVPLVRWGWNATRRRRTPHAPGPLVQ